jgi:hypothetical protein
MKMITNDSIANLSQDKETSKASNPDKQQSDPSAIENVMCVCVKIHIFRAEHWCVLVGVS